MALYGKAGTVFVRSRLLSFRVGSGRGIDVAEMIERVARAIWNEHLCEECVVSSKRPLPSDCCCYAAARAAIEAMRVPTSEILDAGYASPVKMQSLWQAMIDEALK